MTETGCAALLQAGRIEERIRSNHKVPLASDDEVVTLIPYSCTELESGGRMIDAILTNTALPKVIEEFLERMMGSPGERVHVHVDSEDFDYRYE
jgi:type VI secretion system protein VasG